MPRAVEQAVAIVIGVHPRIVVEPNNGNEHSLMVAQRIRIAVYVFGLSMLYIVIYASTFGIKRIIRSKLVKK